MSDNQGNNPQTISAAMSVVSFVVLIIIAKTLIAIYMWQINTNMEYVPDSARNLVLATTNLNTGLFKYVKKYLMLNGLESIAELL